MTWQRTVVLLGMIAGGVGCALLGQPVLAGMLIGGATTAFVPHSQKDVQAALEQVSGAAKRSERGAVSLDGLPQILVVAYLFTLAFGWYAMIGYFWALAMVLLLRRMA